MFTYLLRCLTFTETTRLIRDGEKGGGAGMGGEEGDYIPIATPSPPEMTPALSWAAMRAILTFHSLIVMDKVTRQRPQTTIFSKRKYSRSGIEPRSFRLLAWRLTARLNRPTGSSNPQTVYTCARRRSLVVGRIKADWRAFTALVIRRLCVYEGEWEWVSACVCV